MNAYFEISPDLVQQGQFCYQYWASYDIQRGSIRTRKQHRLAMASQRVWLEWDDGRVIYMKNRQQPIVGVDLDEFFLIKLKSLNEDWLLS